MRDAVSGTPVIAVTYRGGGRRLDRGCACRRRRRRRRIRRDTPPSTSLPLASSPSLPLLLSSPFSFTLSLLIEATREVNQREEGTPCDVRPATSRVKLVHSLFLSSLSSLLSSLVSRLSPRNSFPLLLLFASKSHKITLREEAAREEGTEFMNSR